MPTIFTKNPLWLSSIFWLLSTHCLNAQEVKDTGYLQHAQQLIQVYDYAEAIPLLQKLIYTDSLAPLPRFLLSQSYTQLGKTAAAKQQLEQLLAIAPAHTPALALLAQLHLKETNYRKAAATYDTLLAHDSTNAYFFRQRAYVAEKTEDLPQAIHFYKKAVLLNPQDTESITELAELWLRLHDYSQAAVLIQQGLVQDSSNLRLWKLQAKLAYNQKEYSGVVKAMAHILQAGDSSLYYVQLLGISYFHLGKQQEATQWLTYLEQQGVDSEVFNYYLGLSYRNAGEKAKGIYYLEKAAQKAVSENLSHYYTQLAITYEEKGDHSSAIRAYQLALKGSGNKKLLFHLALNYDQHYKDKRVALRYYQKYLAEVDTVNEGYQEYARYRTTQLKGHIHFSTDSL